MPYRCQVFHPFDQVDVAAWQQVRSASTASIFMDPRFIAGVETSMKQSCRFWYVIIYHDDGRPVACAGLAALTIDLTDLADPRLAWVIERLPLLSRFQRLKVLFCSLPGSPGEKSLALDADQRERTDSFGAGCSNARPGKRHRNGRDRFQGIRGKRFGMDESIARSRISARPDPADACLQAFISRFCPILHSLEDALPPANQPFGAKIKQYGHRAFGPDGIHRNTETVHAGSPCHVL